MNYEYIDAAHGIDLPQLSNSSAVTETLLEARDRAEGYIHGLVDAGHLSMRDTDRDYLILSIVQLRREHLQKLLRDFGY